MCIKGNLKTSSYQNIFRIQWKYKGSINFQRQLYFYSYLKAYNPMEILENNFILIFISGSDFRQRILTSVSDQPVITIPRPGGPRKSSPGKNQSSDGNTWILLFKTLF